MVVQDGADLGVRRLPEVITRHWQHRPTHPPYRKPFPPVTIQTHTHTYTLFTFFTFPRTKPRAQFPLLNCRILYFPSALEFSRFRFGMSELGESRFVWARAAVQRGLSRPNQNVFIDGRKQPGRQHRLAVIGWQVSSVFEIPYVKCQAF